MAADSFPSTLFFGIKDDDHHHKQQQQQQSSISITNSSSTTPTPTPIKKRRNLPGAPNPDAEVIALSPKTLMATNRFICEVCNKGFQREQNLQLHRRGHNLPWKLKQKNPKEVKRKVYLCPEPSCVHHDPSRALGDLTGIKKHFFRKHGEKKYKCEKCSKKYAVQSDWKAHSKTCGTREYRCDCGTLFSRRDSFITHRAFCDALSQENTRHPSSLSTIGSHLFGNGTNSASLNLSHQVINNVHSMPMIHDQNHPLTLGGSKYDHLLPSSNPSMPSSALFQSSHHLNQDLETQPPSPFTPSSAFHSLMHLTPDHHLQSNNNTHSNLLNLGFNIPSNMSSLGGFSIHEQLFNNNNNNLMSESMFSNNDGLSRLFGNTMAPPHMSATALLQKAAQIGSTTSGPGASILKGLASNENQLEGLMNSLGSGKNMGSNNNNNNNNGDSKLMGQGFKLSVGGSDRMTLDFLGVGGGRNINGNIGVGLEMGSFGAKGNTTSSGNANHMFGAQELL
ncbi:protein indeterminate-domain 4, chloroplastic-like [Impatiens glandulifera]|uniref:protein indeterminate-domain 4, chloroplastic-like n=1 Tax=Impatiens glandulifera TaxID=253017 RepID=UPI001FB04F5F|nr:protein indeterminate-domain 4, chloroplastic-like [Impatiens glandulifera]